MQRAMRNEPAVTSGALPRVPQTPRSTTNVNVVDDRAKPMDPAGAPLFKTHSVRSGVATDDYWRLRDAHEDSVPTLRRSFAPVPHDAASISARKSEQASGALPWQDGASLRVSVAELRLVPPPRLDRGASEQVLPAEPAPATLAAVLTLNLQSAESPLVIGRPSANGSPPHGSGSDSDRQRIVNFNLQRSFILPTRGDDPRRHFRQRELHVQLIATQEGVPAWIGGNLATSAAARSGHETHHQLTGAPSVKVACDTLDVVSLVEELCQHGNATAYECTHTISLRTPVASLELDLSWSLAQPTDAGRPADGKSPSPKSSLSFSASRNGSPLSAEPARTWPSLFVSVLDGCDVINAQGRPVDACFVVMNLGAAELVTGIRSADACSGVVSWDVQLPFRRSEHSLGADAASTWLELHVKEADPATGDSILVSVGRVEFDFATIVAGTKPCSFTVDLTTPSALVKVASDAPSLGGIRIAVHTEATAFVETASGADSFADVAVSALSDTLDVSPRARPPRAPVAATLGRLPTPAEDTVASDEPTTVPAKAHMADAPPQSGSTVPSSTSSAHRATAPATPVSDDAGNADVLASTGHSPMARASLNDVSTDTSASDARGVGADGGSPCPVVPPLALTTPKGVRHVPKGGRRPKLAALRRKSSTVSRHRDAEQAPEPPSQPAPPQVPGLTFHTAERAANRRDHIPAPARGRASSADRAASSRRTEHGLAQEPPSSLDLNMPVRIDTPTWWHTVDFGSMEDAEDGRPGWRTLRDAAHGAEAAAKALFDFDLDVKFPTDVNTRVEFEPFMQNRVWCPAGAGLHSTHRNFAEIRRAIDADRSHLCHGAAPTTARPSAACSVPPKRRSASAGRSASTERATMQTRSSRPSSRGNSADGRGSLSVTAKPAVPWYGASPHANHLAQLFKAAAAAAAAGDPAS